jgi:hypothetical protein
MARPLDAMTTGTVQFIIRTEAQQAADRNGFRINRGEEDGWLRFASTTAAGEIWIKASSPVGPWLLALSHPGVAAELPLAEKSLPGPGVARCMVQSLSELHALVVRCYHLGVSLPNVPLEVFHKAISKLPQTTEAERLVVQRIGQDIFRKALLAYWGSCCPLTGITHPALLRASHIVPWSECDDVRRLDVHNGLLLSSLWDTAFDQGLVSFLDSGAPVFSPQLSDRELVLLCPQPMKLVGLTDAHRSNLTLHRKRYGFA